MNTVFRPVPEYDRCKNMTDEDIIAWADRANGTDKSDYHDSWLREYRRDLPRLRTELHIRICCPENYDPQNYYRRRKA